MTFFSTLNLVEGILGYLYSMQMPGSLTILIKRSVCLSNEPFQSSPPAWSQLISDGLYPKPDFL